MIGQQGVIAALARVAADGSILASRGVSTVTKLATGQYQVNFDPYPLSAGPPRPVAHVVTSTDPARLVSLITWSATSVTVRVANTAGSADADGGFSLTSQC